jgi:hypothetical protein
MGLEDGKVWVNVASWKAEPVITFLVLCLGTLLAYCTFDKYTEIGDQLLANHDFANGLQDCQMAGYRRLGVVGNCCFWAGAVGHLYRKKAKLVDAV